MRQLEKLKTVLLDYEEELYNALQLDLGKSKDVYKRQILGVLSWPGLARLVRGQILAEREKEFVTAAKAMGIRELTIIFRHIIQMCIRDSVTTVVADSAFRGSNEKSENDT